MFHLIVTALTIMAFHGHSPGLHPAFGPERSDLSIQKHLHIVLPGMGLGVPLQIIALQFYPHHVAEQLPTEQQQSETSNYPKCFFKVLIMRFQQP